MKSLKTFVLALALLAGISGAFATKTAQPAAKHSITYTWNRLNPGPGTSPFTGDELAAKGRSECLGSTEPCAIGTAPGQDDVFVYETE